MDGSGNLYGANFYSAGDIFELSPNGQGVWTSAVIYSFKGGTKDGGSPNCTPVLDASRNIYSTTEGGGTKGEGTVWKLTPVTTGKKSGNIRGEGSLLVQRG
jgi:hypothetical protein